MTFVTPTDRPKSVRNRCVIEGFGGGFVLSIGFRIFCWYRGFVIGLSQIFFFFFKFQGWFLYCHLSKQFWQFLLTSIEWHSVAWPPTMKNLQRADFRTNCDLITELELFRIIRGFRRTFATNVGCRRETNAHSSRHLAPFKLGFAYIDMLRPIFFPNLSCFFETVHFQHPSVLS